MVTGPEIDDDAFVPSILDEQGRRVRILRGIHDEAASPEVLPARREHRPAVVGDHEQTRHDGEEGNKPARADA